MGMLIYRRVANGRSWGILVIHISAETVTTYFFNKFLRLEYGTASGLLAQSGDMKRPIFEP